MAGPSAVNRAAVVDASFLALLEKLEAEPRREPLDPDAPIVEGSLLTARTAVGLFESMVASRHLDFAARDLKAQGAGYYTIGSSGHEANAVLGELLRLDDWCFLHYRSGGLVVHRARKVAGETPFYDTCLSFCASREDPISGGRHKVWGSHRLRIPPQTSTIASQLPKAVGCAVGLERRRRLGLTPKDEPEDSIAVVSFGDASVNHAVAVTAINAALWTHHQGLPCPVLFVCEDNGIGISVPTPRGWIESQYSTRGLHYVKGDGLDLASAHDAAAEAIETCRYERRPVFLHLEVVRLMAHAGSDVETEYHSVAEIEAVEKRDPLLRAAELLVRSGTLEVSQVRAIYEDARTRARGAAREAASRPRLETLAEVVASLAPSSPERVLEVARSLPDAPARARVWGGEERLPERGRPRHLAAAINAALSDLLVQHESAIVFGEDVGKKGGVYHVTADLQKVHGRARVFDTLLDETSILGLSIGAAHAGLLPIPEIQYLAYLHNAEDQIRGEAGSLSFFSNGQFKNGMVVRVQGLGYQKGFGGHFHNDDAIAVLRDIPGISLCVPSRPADAVEMLRTCVAMAKVDGRVCVFLEPIALYMTKDLHNPGDQGWVQPYPAPGHAAPFGRASVVLDQESPDLVVLTYGNGLFMALRCAARLAQEGVRARVVDLRWLVPLDRETILDQAREVGRVLVLDECRRTAGPSEEVLAAFVEARVDVLVARVTAADTYVPLGPAANLVLPSEEQVLDAARRLARDSAEAPTQALRALRASGAPS